MHRRRGALILAVSGLLLIAIIGLIYVRVRNAVTPLPQISEEDQPQNAPELTTDTIIEGLSNPWDIALLPDGSLLVSERAGQLSRVHDGEKRVLLEIPGVIARGEGGLLGMTIDPDFDDNRFVYACYNTSEDIRVTRWRLRRDLSGLDGAENIVTGIPSNTSSFPGRHSGCRPRFGPDKHLWIGTGDAAQNTNPQNPASLGGKILRVDRDGEAVAGNMDPPFDPRIFSYGHRNVQGLAFNPEGSGLLGYSIEHGPDRDDEINPIRPGNFGWDPGPGYDESVPMTDTRAYPSSIAALWSSGSPTIAPSGGVVLSHPAWKAYEGALAVAVLKDRHVRIFIFDDDNQVASQHVILSERFGRIRSAILGPEGDLYFTTDNGRDQDMIVKVTPH